MALSQTVTCNLAEQHERRNCIRHPAVERYREPISNRFEWRLSGEQNGSPKDRFWPIVLKNSEIGFGEKTLGL
jgi:hypothetical protein